MKRNILSILTFAILGSLFAGYLSFQKLTTKTCVLTEGCGYLFGIPSCVYGFVLFFLILIFALVTMFSEETNMKKTIKIISLIGILYSFGFSIYDLFLAPINILNGAKFTLFLPSCIYGLIFYLIIFIFSNKRQ